MLAALGNETGSRLIRQAVGIFYEAVRLGGDPEQVGFLCSMFASRTAMLRKKAHGSQHVYLANAGYAYRRRRADGICTAHHSQLAPDAIGHDGGSAALASENLAMPLANFSPQQMQFLDAITIMMVVLLAVISAMAIVASDGGYKFKLTLYLAVLLLCRALASGLCRLW
ncbi:hypothetical protein [Candidatus Amarobacter glycogenicus]|uniref:hypothetical protein n=1 Tax=Candidatus Amarobacter glycogenicus TaxID=3140699 RepID=UPI002A1714EE|nr:hypothetical protein [Dehalococcoidia bacterium]